MISDDTGELGSNPSDENLDDPRVSNANISPTTPKRFESTIPSKKMIVEFELLAGLHYSIGLLHEDIAATRVSFSVSKTPKCEDLVQSKPKNFDDHRCPQKDLSPSDSHSQFLDCVEHLPGPLSRDQFEQTRNKLLPIMTPPINPSITEISNSNLNILPGKNLIQTSGSLATSSISENQPVASSNRSPLSPSIWKIAEKAYDDNHRAEEKFDSSIPKLNSGGGQSGKKACNAAFIESNKNSLMVASGVPGRMPFKSGKSLQEGKIPKSQLLKQDLRFPLTRSADHTKVKITSNTKTRKQKRRSPDYPCEFRDDAFETDIHSGRKRYICDYCDEDSISICGLMHHRSHHKSEKAHVCIVCNRRYKQSYSLKTHLKKHDDRRYFQCSICEVVLQTHRGWVRHVNKHMGQDPYLCGKCDESSTQHKIEKKAKATRR